MSGGLMQLVAYGAQDVYLTGNPQITFFKVVYRRYTNFAMESIEQTFNGVSDFGRRVTATISRNGDLITYMYVQVELPKVQLCDAGEYFAWAPEVGHALIRNVEVQIGGQRIDKHYGEWLHIWKELTIDAGKVDGFNKMIGNVDALTGFSRRKEPYLLYIPLQFWFCRDTGNALPLIALQYHEVKIEIEFRTLAEVALLKVTGGSACSSSSSSSSSEDDCSSGTSSSSSILCDSSTIQRYCRNDLCFQNCTMYVDYVYLDTDERRRFAQASHEYLIEQLQYTGEESFTGGQSKPKLNFNHPSKILVWVAQHDSVREVNQWFNFTDRRGVYENGCCEYVQKGCNPLRASKIQLNGHDRFSERRGTYFNWVQPWQHNTNIPPEGINVYSFALNPEEHQPSGSVNFSRIDNTVLCTNWCNFLADPVTASLCSGGCLPVSNSCDDCGGVIGLGGQCNCNGAGGACAGGTGSHGNPCADVQPVLVPIQFGGNLLIYTVNYNVLRIMSGMGGLAYSN